MSRQSEPKSIYKLLAIYIQQAQKFGNYIKGYIDGEDNLEEFIKQYSKLSNTKFIVRSSCKKSKQNLCNDQTSVTNCSRYGQTDRIYWEFNNRNLFVPFTGTPFVINSSQVKQCQYGAQYYKLKAEKCQIKHQMNSGSWNINHNDTVEKGSSSVMKRSFAKPTKKRNCPAYMYIREILRFPDYSLPSKNCTSPNHIRRKEKAGLIAKLKQDMQTKKLSTIHRFFLHIPLPEAHSDHPTDATALSIHIMNPFIKAKIDELITLGYETRHIELIIQDYVAEARAQNNFPGSADNLFPSSDEVKDYIYLFTITAPTIVEVQTKDAVDVDAGITQSSIQSELKKKIEELKNLLHNCKDEETLNIVKLQTKAIVKKLRVASVPQSSRKSSKRITRFPFHDVPKRPRILSNVTKTTKPPEVPFDFFDHTSSERSNSSADDKILSSHTSNAVSLLPVANRLIPTSIQHQDNHTSNQDFLISFNRLLESDQDVLPSLVDHVITDASQFNDLPLSVTSDFISISHLNNE